MILLDITTSYTFRHWRAMGLLRVEQEVIRALREAYGDGVVFGVYHDVLNSYFRVPREEVDALLEAGTWRVPKPERAQTAPSRLRRHLRRFRLAADLRHAAKAARPIGEESPAQAEIRSDALLAEALTRVSLEEYASLRRWLRPLERIARPLSRWMSRADLINHQLHHGQLDGLAPARFASCNTIDPGEVGHYLSVGGFWSDNRAEFAYHARRTHGWQVHYLIYDLIPVLWRHLTEPTTKETFPLALHWMLWGVDQVWTISDTTRQDLLAHVANNGYPPIPPRWVTPILLGADSTAPADQDTSQATLARHDLEPDGYVLMVGTLEPRKNHDFAYRLWRELHRRHPGKVMPLIFVGQPGWRMEGFIEMLAEDTGLPHQAIRILSDVDDDALGALYDNCRFTIYPSHYEGWGLPVVESLNHGKPCLTSDAPSILEAAQDAADTLPLMDGEAWLSRALELMNDRVAHDRALVRAQAFCGYSWEDFRSKLVEDFEAFRARDTVSGARAG